MLAKGDDVVFLLFVLFVVLLFAVFWLDNLIDCSRRVGREPIQVVRLILIVVMPVLGALGYFVFARHFHLRSS